MNIIKLLFISCLFINGYANAEDLTNDKEKTSFNKIERQALIDFYNVIIDREHSVPDDPCALESIVCLNKDYFEINVFINVEKENIKIPESFGDLSKLKALFLNANNSNIVLPNSLGKLINLEELDISNISFLPESLGQLSHLKTFHLQGTLTVLPESFSNLRNLESFSLGFNKITKFPRNIQKLTKLTKLSLSRQTKFPDIFTQLTYLKSLSLKYNSAEIILKSNLHLTELEHLTIIGDSIKFPNHFFYFPKLKSFYLKSEITSLPDDFGNFPLLESLFIQDYYLSELPKNTGNYPNLKYLYLRGLKSRLLPKKFGNYPELINLYIRGTLLTSLNNFSDLRKLKYLVISGNQFLTTLTQGFGNLPALQYALLPGNKLETLPEGFGNNMDLQFLYLNHNKLTSLPRSFGNLSVLHELFLNNNQLTSLPENFGHLKIGWSLHLDHNQLTTLPKSFGDLSIGQGIPITFAASLDAYSSDNNLTLNEIKEKLELYSNAMITNEALSSFEVFIKDYYQQDDCLLYCTLSHHKNNTTLPYFAFLDNEIFDYMHGDGNDNRLGDNLILSLNDNKLTSLPDNFGNLNKIQNLRLYSNQLTSLPESFGNLNKIQDLWLANNQLTSLPENFGNLDNIQDLWLSYNQLTSLPENFGNLDNIQTLTLDNNKLTELPENFGHLPLLETLNLRKNKLKILPNNFGQLSKLTKLHLEYNQLIALPEGFGNLGEFEFLYLEHNKLTFLPNDFSHLKIIEELHLEYNQLNKLPDNFNDLLKIKVLHLEHNQLTLLPENFGELTINELHLEYNNLTVLPATFGFLDGLRSYIGASGTGQIYLDHNQLKILPDNFIQLQENGFERIDLGYNQLSILPKNFARLSLHSLSLEHNQLTELPNDFGMLRYLNYLDLSFNQLSTLPENFTKLTGLLYLSLQNNNFTALPDDIGNLIRLKSFNIEYNHLSVIPESIGQWNQLETLKLGHNQLTFLPETLGNLSTLKTLDLNHNKISLFPFNFSSLINIETLDISHNHFSGIIHSLLGQFKKLNFLTLFDNNFTQYIPQSLTHLISLGDLAPSVSNQISLIPDPTKPIAIIMTTNNELNPVLTQGASNMANLAYRVLKARQLPIENILYLNKNSKQGDDIKVYAPPTKSLLREVFTQWLPNNINNNQDVIIYMVGDGAENQFLYNITEEYTNYLSPKRLNQWLSHLPTNKDPNINLIADFSFSNDFAIVDNIDCRYYSSTIFNTMSRLSFMSLSGGVSFSSSFWNTLYTADIDDSFKQASQDIKQITDKIQRADFICNDTKGGYYDEYIINNKTHLPLVINPITLPKINDFLVPNKVINKEHITVHLKVNLEQQQISKVWVAVISPTLSLNTNEIMDIAEFELNYNKDNQQYTGTITNLNQRGIYQIIAFAQTKDSQLISLPKIASVFVQHTDIPNIRVKYGKTLNIYLDHISFANKSYRGTLQAILYDDGIAFITGKYYKRMKFIMIDESIIENKNNKVDTIDAIVGQDLLDIKIPAIKIDNKYYQVILEFINGSNPPTWELDLVHDFKEEK